MKKKVILEFENEPVLIFVQYQARPGDFDIYQDGKKLEGWKTVRIDAACDNFTTHDIKFLTGHTKIKE